MYDLPVTSPGLLSAILHPLASELSSKHSAASLAAMPQPLASSNGSSSPLPASGQQGREAAAACLLALAKAGVYQLVGEECRGTVHCGEECLSAVLHLVARK